jgi:hypothetical protein
MTVDHLQGIQEEKDIDSGVLNSNGAGTRRTLAEQEDECHQHHYCQSGEDLLSSSQQGQSAGGIRGGNPRQHPAADSSSVTSTNDAQGADDSILMNNKRTDISTGLTMDQVNEAVERYGTNEIPVKVTPLHELFLHHFAGFLPFLIEIVVFTRYKHSSLIMKIGKKEKKVCQERLLFLH